MDNIAKLYALPLEVLTALGAGYIGYKIFATGVDRVHKTHDSIFQVFIFSVPAYLIFGWVKKLENSAIEWAAMASFLGVIAFSLFARRLFPAIKSIPSALGFTDENYWPNTWVALLNEPKQDLKRIDVLLKSGEWLESDFGQVPSCVPHYPADLDTEGNLALYVTGRVNTRGIRTLYGKQGVNSDDWGATITYIPQREIRRVQFCKKAKQPQAVWWKRMALFFWRWRWRWCLGFGLVSIVGAGVYTCLL